MLRAICFTLWFLSVGMVGAQQPATTTTLDSAEGGQQPNAPPPDTPANLTAGSASGVPQTIPSPTAPTLTIACPAPASAQDLRCDWIEALGTVAWPIVAVIALGVLVLNRQLRRGLTRLLRRVNKVKGGPLELEFSAEAAKDVSASIRDDLMDFKAAASSEYDRQARAHDLDQRLRAAVDALRQSGTVAADSVRATVHVPDVVLRGYLYQLLDYQPDETGRGRRWSERYGILGRAWRMRQSIYANHALGNIQPALERGQAEEELIRNWGMNREEAERSASGAARQSFICIILRVQTRQVGVLYLDSSSQSIFGRAAQSPDDPLLRVKPDVESLPAVLQLAEGVDKAMEGLRGGGTYLDF